MTTDFGLDVLDDLQRSQEEGIDVPIYAPGNPESVLLTIKVVGPDSTQQARATERSNEELAARGALTPLTREENAESAYRFLARCCKGWTAKSKDGVDVPFSEDAAIEMFRRYPLIKQAVDQAAGTRARFIRRSPTA